MKILSSLSIFLLVCSTTNLSFAGSHQALAGFLANPQLQIGLFSDDAEIRFIQLESKKGEPLRYRIETSNCAARITFDKDGSYSVENVNCLPLVKSTDLTTALKESKDMAEFRALLNAAYMDSKNKKDEVLEISLNEIERRYDSVLLDKASASVWLDTAMSVFMVTGNSVSGGFVENGKLSPLENHILESQPRGLARKFANLKGKLGL